MSTAGRTHAWPGTRGHIALVFGSRKPARFAVLSEGVMFLFYGDHAFALLLRQYMVDV